jgi:hypothetical protein
VSSLLYTRRIRRVPSTHRKVCSSWLPASIQRAFRWAERCIRQAKQRVPFCPDEVFRWMQALGEGWTKKADVIWRSCSEAAGTPQPLAVPEPVAEVTGDMVVQMLIRNVHLHVAHGVVPRIDDLRGEMRSPGGPGQPPILGDASSYSIRIDSARVGMDMPSMG